jgi:hypothetical protein
MQQQPDNEQPISLPESSEQTQKKTSALYKQRMLELASALNSRLEERAKANYFSTKEFRKRKDRNKQAKRSRRKNRR